MQNHEKIKKYLENLENSPYSEGSEGKAFFVGDNYILKVLRGAEEKGNGCSLKYVDPEYFYTDMEVMSQISNKLNKSGIKVPKIEDYAVLSVDGSSKKQQVILEERILGNPVGIDLETNLQGEENRGLIEELRKYEALKDGKNAKLIMDVLTRNLNKYNLEVQESLLDAPDSVLVKFVKDIEKIHTKHGQVRLDPYCGNLIYNDDTKKLTIIDFNTTEGGVKPDLGRMLADILSYFAYPGYAQYNRRIDPQVWKNSDNLVCKLLVAAYDNGLWKYPVANNVELGSVILSSIQDERVKSEVFTQLFYRR